MNSYLTKEVRDRLKHSMVRFDDDLTGKLVDKSIYDSNLAAMSFTDGTWCAVEAEYDGEDADLDHVYQMGLTELKHLDLITDEEYAAAAENYKSVRRKLKLQEIERLQKEIDRD